MKNKLDLFLDALYGQKVKGRWIKLLITITVVLFLIGSIIFFSTNLGYENGKFYLRPWKVKIDVDVDLKKDMTKKQNEVEQK